MRGALRHTALILATAALSVQLAGWAHLASQRHATCSEHGELIEVGPEAGSTVDSPRLPHASVQAVEGDEAGHGHNHCLTAAQSHQRATGTHRACQQLHVSSTASGGLTPGESPLANRQAILLVAPKTSPPALV